MTVYEQALADFQPTLDAYKKAIEDGHIDTNEILPLLFAGIKSVIKLLDGFSDLTPDEAKVLGLQLVSQFYDVVLAPIDIPGVPNIIEPYVDQLGKTLILSGVEKIFDALKGSDKIAALLG